MKGGRLKAQTGQHQAKDIHQPLNCAGIGGGAGFTLEVDPPETDPLGKFLRAQVFAFFAWQL